MLSNKNQANLEGGMFKEMQKRFNEIQLLKGRDGLYWFKYNINDNSGTNTPIFPINNVWVDKGVVTDENQISTLKDQIKETP